MDFYKLKVAAIAPLRNDLLFSDINVDPHQFGVNIVGHRQKPTRRHINQFGVHAVIVCVLVWVSCQIIILWNSEKPPPHRSKWPPMPVPLIITDGRRKVSIQVREQSSHVCERFEILRSLSLHLVSHSALFPATLCACRRAAVSCLMQLLRRRRF